MTARVTPRLTAGFGVVSLAALTLAACGAPRPSTPPPPGAELAANGYEAPELLGGPDAPPPVYAPPYPAPGPYGSPTVEAPYPPAEPDAGADLAGGPPPPPVVVAMAPIPNPPEAGSSPQSRAVYAEAPRNADVIGQPAMPRGYAPPQSIAQPVPPASSMAPTPSAGPASARPGLDASGLPTAPMPYGVASGSAAARPVVAALDPAAGLAGGPRPYGQAVAAVAADADSAGTSAVATATPTPARSATPALVASPARPAAAPAVAAPQRQAAAPRATAPRPAAPRAAAPRTAAAATPPPRPQTPAQRREALGTALTESVKGGAVLTGTGALTPGTAGTVALALPAKLGETLTAKAAELKLPASAAQNPTATAVLSGPGYTIDPAGPQTAPVVTGTSPQFNWRVTPGEGSRGPLSAAVTAEAGPARDRQTFQLGTVAPPTATPPRAARGGISDRVWWALGFLVAGVVAVTLLFGRGGRKSTPFRRDGLDLNRQTERHADGTFVTRSAT